MGANSALRFAAACLTILGASSPGWAQGVQITSTTLPFGGVSQSYQTQLTATGGATPYTWSLPNGAAANVSPLPPGLTLSTDGIISGIPKTAGTYPFTITVTSLNKQQASASVQIIVIQVETTSLPNGQTNVPYSQGLNVTSGNPAWDISAGSLPPGLSLSPTGLLNGTPTKTGSYSFTVRATVQNTNGASVTATKDFTLSITTGPLGLVTSSLPDGTVGVQYSQTVNAAGGTGPYTITADPTTLPPGLTFIGSQLLSGTPGQAGTYNILFQVRDFVGGSASKTIPINILPVGGVSVQVSPMTITFNAFVGGRITPPQSLVVFLNTASTIPLSVTLPQQAPWLSFAGQTPFAPAQLRIRANPAGLSAGTYQTTLHITPGTQRAVDVPITFVVSPAVPALSVAPRIVQRTSRTVNPTQDISISLTNTGGGATVNYTASLLNSSKWITNLTGATGQLTPTDASYIRFTLNATGLKAGAFRDVLTISSSLGQIQVPISLFIEQSGPILTVPANGIRLIARQGDPTGPVHDTFQVRNRGTNGTSVNWTASIIRGSSQTFSISPTSGTAMSNSPSVVTVGLKTGATAGAGPRVALLKVEDPQALSSPDYVVLVADIAPNSTSALLQLAPSGLLFVGAAGGASPATQTFAVRTSAPTLAYGVATSINTQLSWLSVASPSGTAGSGADGSVTVKVNSAGLSSGVYSGLVTVASGTQVVSEAITLVLLPTGAQLPASGKGTQPRDTVGCTSSSASIIQTGLAEAFSVPAGWPATISARLVDNCGGALPNGDMIASFSNGDAPLVLDGDSNGVFTGTWQPGASASSATVVLEANSGALSPARLEVSGSVGTNALSIPSLVTGGFLHNLNPLVGAPLAPGTVTQTYGDNMAPAPDIPTTVPLPTNYKGVEAIIGGYSAPIYYISQKQLTIQVPAELTPNELYTAIVATDSGYSLPTQVELVSVQPGTVAFGDGTLITQHADYTLVTAQSPAKPGETIILYLVGMGATSPAVASGFPAPGAEPLARVTTNAIVTIDGQQAPTPFQGLTPGGVGLYQINVTVPMNTKSGLLDVVISQGGNLANATKLIVGAP